MATRAQQAKVGIFLIGSAVLIVAGIATMQGMNREPVSEYEIQFDESILGLGEGGLVEYLGVPVGNVTDIYVGENNSPVVIIEVNNNKVTVREDTRAQLVMLSFATGQMAISLKGGGASPVLPPGSKIPTAASTIQNFTKQFDTLIADINNIVTGLSTALQGMEPGQMTNVLQELEGLLSDGRAFMENANTITDSLESNMDDAVNQYTELAKDLRDVSQSANEFLQLATEKLEPLDFESSQQDIEAALKNFAEMSEKLNRAVDSLDDVTTAVVHETDNIENSIREGMDVMTETMESVRALTETLNEDPSSVIRGRGQPQQR